jgi:hypothetical protein
MEALFKGRVIRGRFAEVLINKGIATVYEPTIEPKKEPAEKVKNQRSKKKK